MVSRGTYVGGVMANEEKKVVILTDLSQQGFETLTVGQNRSIVPRVSTVQGNKLSLGDDGLKVVDDPVRHFVLNPTQYVRLTHSEDTRRILYLTGAFGVLHLDFQLARGGPGKMPLFNIPDGCPTPLHLIEHIVNGGQPLWWAPNERTIYCDSRVTRDQRIIIHAAGIFR